MPLVVSALASGTSRISAHATRHGAWLSRGRLLSSVRMQTVCATQGGAAALSWRPAVRGRQSRNASGPLATRRSRVQVRAAISTTPTAEGATSAVASEASELDFAAYVKEKNAAIEQGLSDSVPMMYPERLHESMRYSLLAGGKRIRPW